MNEIEREAIDRAFANQINALFEGMCSDLAMGIKPGTPSFEEMLQRVEHGIQRARYVKEILSGLLNIVP